MPFEYLILFLATTFGATFGLIFGGGSFVVFPLLFQFGVDPKVAVATNLVAAIAQLVTGSLIFSKKGKVDFKVVKKTAPFYLVGGILGAFVLIDIEADFIKMLVSGAIIFFALFSLFKKKSLLEGSCTPVKKQSFFGILALTLGGIYQTSVTAGAGTLLTFILIYLYGLSLKCAIYTRQIVNLPAMVVAGGILMYQGLVDWYLLIPLILGRVAGALIGSKLLIKSRSKALSIVFTIVVVALALKTIIN